MSSFDFICFKNKGSNEPLRRNPIGLLLLEHGQHEAEGGHKSHDSNDDQTRVRDVRGNFAHLGTHGIDDTGLRGDSGGENGNGKELFHVAPFSVCVVINPGDRPAGFRA